MGILFYAVLDESIGMGSEIDKRFGSIGMGSDIDNLNPLLATTWVG